MVKEAISLSKEKQDKIKIYNEIIKAEKVNSKEVCVVGERGCTSPECDFVCGAAGKRATAYTGAIDCKTSCGEIDALGEG